MIILHRLNGPPFALNPDLVERADITPDTVLTLVDGTKYVVAESVDEVIDRVREFRASIVALSNQFELRPVTPTLHVLPDPTTKG
ncbi:MAG: flagellar FlbD family protein [Actinomycetota bacterium]|nr:flagellar FlbD family protein [Actinomycetota bacterium]